MKFNSQICTTREQSERLLALGLKKETADMTWDYSHTMKGIPQYDCRAESTWDPETFASYVEHCEKLGYFEHWKHPDGSQMAPEEVYAEITKKNIPAWSLHRLVEMMPSLIWYGEYQYSLNINDDGVIYDRMGIAIVEFIDDNLFDNMIACIRWLIEKNQFYKEYLVDLTSTDAHQDMIDVLSYAINNFKKEDFV